jgi:hypothetical protein
MLYKYLRRFSGITATHTTATFHGTDWRNNDPEVEPSVEIYQGARQSYEMPGAPRGISAGDANTGYNPDGFVSLALGKGYRLGFESSSDHASTHLSFANLLVTAPTREAMLDAFRKRHIYAATDHILAEFRSGGHFMGDEFTTAGPPNFCVRLRGTAPFARVLLIKDNSIVYSRDSDGNEVVFTWQDLSAENGKTSYYYVRGEQVDGQLVWISPMWVTFQPK